MFIFIRPSDLKRVTGQIPTSTQPGKCWNPQTKQVEPTFRYDFKWSDLNFRWLDLALGQTAPRMFTYFLPPQGQKFDPKCSQICIPQTLKLQAEYMGMTKSQWGNLPLPYRRPEPQNPPGPGVRITR